MNPGVGDDKTERFEKSLLIPVVLGGLAGALAFMFAYRLVTARIQERQRERLERRAKIVSVVLEEGIREGIESVADAADKLSNKMELIAPDMLFLEVKGKAGKPLRWASKDFDGGGVSFPSSSPYRWKGAKAWIVRLPPKGTLLFVEYIKGMFPDAPDVEVKAVLSFRKPFSLMERLSDGDFCVVDATKGSILYIYGGPKAAEIPQELFSEGAAAKLANGRMYAVRDLVPGGLMVAASGKVWETGFPWWLGSALMFVLFCLAAVGAQLPVRKRYSRILERERERLSMLKEQLASLVEDLGGTPDGNESALLHRVRNLWSAGKKSHEEDIKALERLMERAEGTVVLLDDDRKILRASRRFLSLVGVRDESELRNRPLDDFLFSDEGRKRLIREWSFLRQGTRISFSTSISSKNKPVPVSLAAEPRIGDSGKVEGAWAAVFDKRRAMFDQNVNVVRKRLDEISVLAADIAHNFNNALCAVMGGLSLMELRMKRKAGDLLDEDISKDLETVKRAAHTATALVRQLMKLSPGSVDATGETPFDDFVELLRTRLDASAEASGSIKGDEKIALNRIVLFRILKEAVSNVRSRIGEKRKLKITASALRGENAPLGDSTDSVIAKRLLMLEIFPEGEGTGAEEGAPLEGGLKWLELQRLLVDSGGGIIENSPQRPTPNVVLYLPLLEEEEETAAEHEPLNVLVIDDEFGVARTIAEFFNVIGEKADFILDWRRAKELLAEKRYDLVVLDLSLSGGNLAEVLDTILAEGNPKIAVASGTPPRPDEKMELARRGITWFLLKPVNIEDVRKLVRRVVKSSAES